MRNLPHTPLPWSPVTCTCGRAGCHSGNVEPFVVKYQGAADIDDARYIAHAANAYPKLVKALQALAPLSWGEDFDRAKALLRELGEDA